MLNLLVIVSKKSFHIYFITGSSEPATSDRALLKAMGFSFTCPSREELIENFWKGAGPSSKFGTNVLFVTI